MGVSQLLLFGNMAYSLFFGPPAGRNPWNANSLEWMAPSPPGHGNFDAQPIVYRGPYEYNTPGHDTDNYPQWEPPKPGEEPPPDHH
jgi:cytochrome c oxidase subunit I